MKKHSIFITALIISIFYQTNAIAAFQQQSGAKLFKYSSTIEKERPQLNDETKRLIANYRQNPTAENWDALRRQAEINYDKVVERKKAKLEELKMTARHTSKIEEMQQIVDEMLRDRENRINQTMSRFTDPRLRPNSRKNQNGYLPVLGAAQNVYIAYTPVTNSEYFVFVNETGKKAPDNWINKKIPAGKEQYPVTNISYNDAVEYCNWLSQKDTNALYRLPTEAEWELAAGHMPKDADMNCGENNGTSSVTSYAQTLAACGAIDMWGNVWEWTSDSKTTDTGQKEMFVKGGAWNTPRTKCRTEYRDETRSPTLEYDTVGFRIVKEQLK